VIVLWVNDGRTDMPYIFGSLDRTAVKPYQKYNVDWLTVHHSITLVDLQLDAQNSCLFTYNTLIKLLYMFRALPRPSSGGLRRNCIYAASGIVTLCRWLSCAPVKKLVEEFNKCIICKYTKICSSSWRSNQGHNVELSSYLDLSSTGRLPRFETMQCLHLDARHTPLWFCMPKEHIKLYKTCWPNFSVRRTAYLRCPIVSPSGFGISCKYSFPLSIFC